jgi:hypothetical protein
VLPGSPEASVTLLVRDRPTTMVSTGRLAVDLYETQYECGHGPCLHAARTGELVEIADTRSDTVWRDYCWRDYCRRAAAAGNLAQVSMNADRKVRDVADHLVHTGELPVPAPGNGRRAARRGVGAAKEPRNTPEQPRPLRQCGSRPASGDSSHSLAGGAAGSDGMPSSVGCPRTGPVCEWSRELLGVAVAPSRAASAVSP